MSDVSGALVWFVCCDAVVGRVHVRFGPDGPSLGRGLEPSPKGDYSGSTWKIPLYSWPVGFSIEVRGGEVDTPWRRLVVSAELVHYHRGATSSQRTSIGNSVKETRWHTSGCHIGSSSLA